MANLMLALELAEKLNKSQIKMLRYFVEHKTFEGSYRELSRQIHGKPELASNTRLCAKSLEDIGALMISTNDECLWSDTNRTYIEINPDWIK